MPVLVAVHAVVATSVVATVTVTVIAAVAVVAVVAAVTVVAVAAVRIHFCVVCLGAQTASAAPCFEAKHGDMSFLTRIK